MNKGKNSSYEMIRGNRTAKYLRILKIDSVKHKIQERIHHKNKKMFGDQVQ